MTPEALPTVATAYAKINLALHVRRRRDDGYHELETAFAFVDQGDTLSARPVEADTLRQHGEFADAMGLPFGNLAMRALSSLPRSSGIEIALEKTLPVAAGLGGGSADAGAVFRIVREMFGLPDDWQERAAKLGADVPACVESEACIGRGTGTELGPLENDMAGMPVLLVNPRVAVSTSDVYAAWDGTDAGPLEGKTAREIVDCNRNDLERIVTENLAVEDVVHVLNALSDTDPLVRRMSGSGATCFALYDTAEMRDAARASIQAHAPDWWTLSGNLR